MRLIDRIRSVPVERAFTPDPATIMTSLYGGGTGERMLAEFMSYAQQGFLGNSIIFSLIAARMRLFSEASFKFRNLTDKHLYGNPDLLLLETPWPSGTTGDLLARMEQDVSLAGNAFIARTPARLIRLRPDWVEIVSEIFEDPETGHEVRDVVGYIYRPVGDGQHAQFWDVADVAHWSPIPDPLATWRGMSWMTPIVREINADIALSDHATKYIENAATPNLIIKHKNKLQPETVRALVARVDARHGGPDNAGKTMVIDAGADLEIVGNNLAEMDFTGVQGGGEVRMASAAGVPPIVVGLSAGLDAATYSNYALAMRAFADLWARPQWRSAAASLAKLVAVPDGSELWYDTTDIAALRDSEADRAERGWTVAQSISVLITQGFTADSVIKAVVADDWSLLVHSGLVSVQLQKPGDPIDPPNVPPVTPTSPRTQRLLAQNKSGGTP